jgi:hypothetical protein
VALLICMLSAGAQAQWQWIDKDGRKVFSDRGPPPDIPAKNVLKQPGGAGRAALPAVGAASAPARAASGASPSGDGQELATPTLSGVDKELADKKKLADAAEAAKARAVDERAKQARADNCAQAKASKALMDSGVRVSLSTNAKGEREVLDDAGRAAENKRIRQVIEATCN